MTLEGRLARLDETLSPTQLVLRWMAEAHSFGDLEPYVNSLAAQDPPVAPLDRLAREAVHGARAAMRGKRPEIVNPAVRSALRETIFRFELVMRINVTTKELLDREQLISALFASQLAMLLGAAPEKEVAGESHLRRLKLCRRLTLLRVDELLASREARSSVEARYLDGHPALFPRGGDGVREAAEIEPRGRGHGCARNRVRWRRTGATPRSGHAHAPGRGARRRPRRTGQVPGSRTSSAKEDRRSTLRLGGCGRSWRAL